MSLLACFKTLTRGTFVSVNRTELVAQIAERAELNKTQADAALSALQDVLIESVSKGESVRITGLFAVERTERAARTGRNPRTGEEIQIPAGYGVKITAGSTLKNAVKKQFFLLTSKGPGDLCVTGPFRILCRA